MIKLTRGQKAVLALTSLPLTALGAAGGYATFQNMTTVLGDADFALSIAVAGEGAVFMAALVSLSLTLLGQHTPGIVRSALWLLPLTASVAGTVLASTPDQAVVLALSPVGMTVAAEGVTLVARRIVRFQTGVDLESQRRAGLLVWHAGRAKNGGWLAKRLSKAAVWRLTRSFASTDGQMHIQVDDIQRYRVSENLDANLLDVLTGTAAKAPDWVREALDAPSDVRTAPFAGQLPAAPAPAATEPLDASAPADDPDGFGFIKSVLAEAEQQVTEDPAVKLMTVAEIAALKGVSTGTVRSWLYRGKLSVAERDDYGRALIREDQVALLD